MIVDVELQARIRLAQERDAARLTALVNSAYRGESSRQGWTTEAELIAGQRTDLKMMLETIRNTSVLILTSRDPNRERGNDSGSDLGSEKAEAELIVGCVSLMKLASGIAYLGMLTVDPTQQGRGYGDLLMTAAEKFCREEFGSRSIEITVIHVRLELIQWYERRGFQETGETRPFPYGQDQFGLPLRSDLLFKVFTKQI